MSYKDTGEFREIKQPVRVQVCNVCGDEMKGKPFSVNVTIQRPSEYDVNSMNYDACSADCLKKLADDLDEHGFTNIDDNF